MPLILDFHKWRAIEWDDDKSLIPTEIMSLAAHLANILPRDRPGLNFPNPSCPCKSQPIRRKTCLERTSSPEQMGSKQVPKWEFDAVSTIIDHQRASHPPLRHSFARQDWRDERHEVHGRTPAWRVIGLGVNEKLDKLDGAICRSLFERYKYMWRDRSRCSLLGSGVWDGL